MFTNLKLNTGALGLAVKMRMMPAGKDIVRSPVILTRQLKHRHTANHYKLELQCDKRLCPPDGVKEAQTDRLCSPPLK